MKRACLLLLSLLLSVPLVVACGSSNTTTPPTTTTTPPIITTPPTTTTETPSTTTTTTLGVSAEEIEIRQAPIHEVQVNTESFCPSCPAQIFVYIKGGLSDSCTTFNELKTERSGNTINITVTTKRPGDAICTQVYGYFEKMVTLFDFIGGESYTINVNDVTTGFLYPDY